MIRRSIVITYDSIIHIELRKNTRTSKYLEKYKFYKRMFHTKIVECKKICILAL